jgi:hypothetical protein
VLKNLHNHNALAPMLLQGDIASRNEIRVRVLLEFNIHRSRRVSIGRVKEQEPIGTGLLHHLGVERVAVVPCLQPVVVRGDEFREVWLIVTLAAGELVEDGRGRKYCECEVESCLYSGPGC